MEATRRPETADPEFDFSPPPRVRLTGLDRTEYQRLVVNPFLAVLGLLVLGQGTVLLLQSPFQPLAIATIVPIALLPYLIQYHCLDCGRTGPYPRHRGHACPGVLARWRDGRRSRLPFPTPRFQLVVWGWLLGSVGVLLAITGTWI